MFAIFDKNTKEFIGYGENDIPEQFAKNLVFKEIPEDKKDLTMWSWVGDYDDGEMTSLFPEDEDTVFLYQKIYNEYPIDIQLVIMMDQLKALAIKNNCITEDFKNMSDLILKAVEKKEKQDKFV